MTIVHQAIYGDKGGSYALLKTSLADTELAKRICNATDLLDRPSNGYLTQPVFRGFALSDHYIFIKSFPDNDPTVRKGRVLSHVLIVEEIDLHLIDNLDELLSHFLSEPDKEYELEAIVIGRENTRSNKTINIMSREAAAINGLLHHSSCNNTLIWIGEDNYLIFLAQIWRELGGNVRAKINMGVGFNPNKIDTLKHNILYVIEEYENRWKFGDICIVGKQEVGTLETMSSFRLAGHKDESKPLDDLIRAFGMVPDEVEDYRYIETGVSTYSTLSSATDFKRLIVLCDLVSRYSPDVKVAKNEKRKLLLEVTSRINPSSADQVSKLKNVDWNGFYSGQQLIGEKITNWVEVSLLGLKVDESVTNVINAAFDQEGEATWWKKALSDGLQSTLKEWKPAFAMVIWNWLVLDHNLINRMGCLLPAKTQVETDLVNVWQKPDAELAHKIQVFARARNWLTLHGLSALQLLGPEEGIKSQLIIDTDPEHSVALTKMGESIAGKEFLQLTVNIGELRLVKIAAEILASTPSLISQLDAKNIVWRQIWLESIEQGMHPYDAIKEPEKVLFMLLEQVANGVDIEPKLLMKFSGSDYNDLSNFRQRSKIWMHLDEGLKAGFLGATTLGCVRLLDKQVINISDLEEDIRVCLSNADIISQVIRDQAISVATKILLFKELSGFKENVLIKLLDEVIFSPEESEDIGKFIFSRHWGMAAEAVASKVSSRKDLKPALKECQSLLGFFEKLKLLYLGHSSETVSEEEWWSAFSEQCYTKYQKGPADKGLWGRSGGEGYDLHAAGTGREIWMDAIGKMRNGVTDVDVKKLLKEMSKDYPNSDELRQLKKAYK